MSGDTKIDFLVRVGREGEEQKAIAPEDAETIAWTAASSSTDIERGTVELPSDMDVCSEVLFEANIVK
jgi:hypothetical protein